MCTLGHCTAQAQAEARRSGRRNRQKLRVYSRSGGMPCCSGCTRQLSSLHHCASAGTLTTASGEKPDLLFPSSNMPLHPPAAARPPPSPLLLIWLPALLPALLLHTYMPAAALLLPSPLLLTLPLSPPRPSTFVKHTPAAAWPRPPPLLPTLLPDHLPDPSLCHQPTCNSLAATLSPSVDAASFPPPCPFIFLTPSPIFHSVAAWLLHSPFLPALLPDRLPKPLLCHPPAAAWPPPSPRRSSCHALGGRRRCSR